MDLQVPAGSGAAGCMVDLLRSRHTLFMVSFVMIV